MKFSRFPKLCFILLFSLVSCRSALSTLLPNLSVGQNFTGSTYNVNNTSIPPDANGAVGPRHFVELINGSCAIYNKTNGLQVKRITDAKFWANAGVILSTDDATTDPRVVYDPLSQRWFATMVDASASANDPTLYANDFLLAVSSTSDPTGTWHGFLFQADPDNGFFADFPTLGVDSNAVYISGDFFTAGIPIGPGLVSIPKTNLLAAIPSIDNRTWYGVMDYSIRGDVLQPVNCFDGSESGKIISITDIGSDSSPHSNLVIYAVQNGAGTNAFLSSSVFIPTPSWVVPDNDVIGAPSFASFQPDGTQTLQANDARLCDKAYAVNGIIYAAHNTELNNHIAIRWYRVRAFDNVLLETGTLSDPNMDLFFPSIAANPYGVVVIGYNASGLAANVSSYAVAGQTFNGTTSFGSPLLLRSGATSYHGDDELLGILLESPTLSRWGDYTATSPDPNDPNRFWTIQIIPSDTANEDVWSTQITELVTTPQMFLGINHSGTNVTMYWPLVTGYQLQASTNIQSSSAWTNVTQTPITNGSWFNVSLQPSAKNQFFRLKK